MNKIMGIFLLVFLPCTAYAHDHALALRQGECIWGLNLYISAGNEVAQYFTVTDGYVSMDAVTVFSTECRTAWAGDCLSFEYALFDGFSLGLKTNAVQALTYAFRDGVGDVQGAVYMDLNFNSMFHIPSDFPFTFAWNEELQIALLYTTNPSAGDGLMNLFTTLSGNFKAVSMENFTLNLYLDGKVITNFTHPYYTFRWMTAAFYQDLLGSLGLSTTDDFSVALYPGTKLVAALGIDVVLFKNILFFVGLNVPIVAFMTDENCSPQSDWLLPATLERLFGLDRLEFELKFKL